MKATAAIIQPAEIDLALVQERITVERAGERDQVKTAERHEGESRRHGAAAQAARESARQHRLRIGRLLAQARPLWPARGPAPKGATLPPGAPASWAEFLRRLDLDDATARRYMDEARDPESFAQRPRGERNPAGEDEQSEPVLGQERDTPPFRQLTKADLIQAIGRLSPEDRKDIVRAARPNVKGGSGEIDRGTWCTAKDWAIAVGAWDLDPFSNPRSHILSVTRCMLEDGGDAFGGSEPGARPGFYRTGNAHGAQPTTGVADDLTRVWIQPPYELVPQAIAHYGHTRFCALLRWSPDVKAWFPELWRRTAVVAHPWCERMEFEAPPGVEKSGDMPFPHALFYACESDITDAVRARCILHHINHDTDDVRAIPALHIVR
jgi:hypothetical protein